MLLTALQNFFSYNDYGYPFELFDLQHLIATIVFAIIPMLLIFLFRNKIKAMKHERVLAVLIASFGLALEFIQYYWHYHGGQTDWRHIFPTTLCGLTIYLSCIAMITKNKFISSVIYFYSYGAFFSFLFAEQPFGYDRFRFYAYFIIHGIILVNTVYLMSVRGIRSDLKSLLNASILITPILALSFVANALFSDATTVMNYFYVREPLFEFPVYSALYEMNPIYYSIAACVSYYLLFLIMFGLGKIIRTDKPKIIAAEI